MEAAASVEAIVIPPHDSFFQAIADVLNVRDNKTDADDDKHTVQSLREACYDYALNKAKAEDSWVFGQPIPLGKYPAINRTQYLKKILSTLPGHEEREGKILCEQYNFVLNVHWYQHGKLTGRADIIVQKGADPTTADINKRICINCTVDESPLPRHGLFTHEKSNSAEKRNLFTQAIPSRFSLSNAIGKGDCFYDACAQALNEIFGTEEYTVKSLRLLCYEYAVALDARCGTSPDHDDNWIGKAFNNPAKYQEYLANVRYTVEERERGAGTGTDRDNLAVWGEHHIDGRIICEKLGVKLHGIEVRENPEEATKEEQKFIVGHTLVDQSGLNNVGAGNINWKDKKTIHIAACNLHFVPILKKITIDKKLASERIFSAEKKTVAPKIQAVRSTTGFGSADLDPDDEEEYEEEEEGAELLKKQAEEEAAEKARKEAEEEEKYDGEDPLPPIELGEEYQQRVRPIADIDAYRSSLIQRQRRAISADKKQAKKDENYVKGSIASYLNFLAVTRRAGANGAIFLAYRQKDVEHYGVVFRPDGFTPPKANADTRIAMPERKRKQIFNPIKYAEKLEAKRDRLLALHQADRSDTEIFGQLSRIIEKIEKFTEFMEERARQARKDKKAEKYYMYNLYKYGDGTFECETDPDGSVTARQIFGTAISLFFSNLRFWSMWYQGAATFYQSSIEEGINLGGSIYCTFSAVYGKIKLVALLNEEILEFVANLLFDFLLAPLSKTAAGILWFLRGEWSYDDLIRVLGFAYTAVPVGLFFAFLTPKAAEGLEIAIAHHNLTHTAPYDTILAISNNSFVKGMSMVGGSGLLNTIGTPGAFGFTQTIQAAVIARQLWVSRASPAELLSFTTGLAAFALFGWYGMGKNFQLLGTANFEYYLGIGNAAPVLAVVPTAFIMMLFWTTGQALVFSYGPMLRDIAMRKFNWESLRERNKKEFPLGVQIVLNGVSFIVTLGFTTTGALTTLWQQKISGQVVTPFVRVAGVIVATVIEWGVMQIVSTGLVEGTAMYAWAGIRRPADFEFTDRKKLPAMSDDPDDDTNDPVGDFEKWVKNKSLEQTKPVTITNNNNSTGNKSSTQSSRCCSWFRRRRPVQLLNVNDGADAIPLMPVLPAGQAQPPAESTRARSWGCGIQ